MIKEKNILIIGGTSGIGLALVELISATNNVFVASRSNDSIPNLDVQHIPFDATTDILDVSLLPEHLGRICVLSREHQS